MNTRVHETDPGMSFSYAPTWHSFASRVVWGWLHYTYALILVAVLVMVYLNLPNYGNTLNSALAPKYFYFTVAFLLCPLFVQSKALLAYILSPFALWAFICLILNLIHLLGVADGEFARMQIILMRIQYLMLTLLLGFAFAYARTASYEWVFPLIAFVAPAIVILDFIVPSLLYPSGTPGTVPGRASATYINPTIAGEVILLAYVMAIPALKMVYRTPLLILAGIGVTLTFSRSSIIAWIALWVILQSRRVLPKSAFLLLVAGLISIPLLITGFSSYIENRHDLTEAVTDLQSRLNFFSQMQLDDRSAAGRSAMLQAGWNLFLEYPVEGAGAGATYVWWHSLGVHNQLILFAAEYGLAGLLLWMSLGIVLARGKYFEDKSLQLTVLFLFVFNSMFTHNMLDMLHWLLTFALVSGRRRT
ncbi:O-antigen ligase family protein [Herbaspirillum sp. GCM10030257]|uniref:O-antigen ligase family protein n=1 Tax=Herbaspirillum sp. GCM10030257 TaxID=3273393 RepID=UPI003612B8C4